MEGDGAGQAGTLPERPDADVDLAVAPKSVADEEVPETLTLSHFLGRPDLADCVVRIPREPAHEEVHCHKLALCSSSGYFYRRFVAGTVPAPEDVDAASLPAADLPALPEDAELRRQVNIAGLFPVVLQYMYSNQCWDEIAQKATPETAIGLFVLAHLLDIRSLCEKLLQYLKSSLVDAKCAIRLLYTGCQLQGSGNVFEKLCEQCVDVLRLGFHSACEQLEDVGLLCQMPFETLEQLLKADDLDVPTEGSVLNVVRTLLRGRMRREEAVLRIRDATISDANRVWSRLSAGCVWEVSVFEDREPMLDQKTPSAPAVAKYAAQTEPLCLESGPRSSLWNELELRVPTRAVGVGREGCMVLRASVPRDQNTGFEGEVLLAGRLPVDSFPTPMEAPENEGAAGDATSGPKVEEQSIPLQTPEGDFGGVLHFKWSVEPVPPPPDEDVQGAEGDPPQLKAPGAPMSDKEAKRILDTVRFEFLKQEELLAAMQDPIIVETLARTGGLTRRSDRDPRPSTLRGVASGIPAKGSGQPCEAPHLTLPKAFVPSGTLRRGTSPATASRAMGQASPSSRGVIAGNATGRIPGAGGVAGHPLFPCAICGQGQLHLRQQDMLWCVRCSRSACQQTLYLPSAVMGAAVDGHCAACTLRLGRDVRTLTIRVGREYASTLLKLPGGVDTLRGLCIAGCNDTLQRLSC